MDHRRLGFAVALTFLLLWAASLGTMSVLSGHRPESPRKSAIPR